MLVVLTRHQAELLRAIDRLTEHGSKPYAGNLPTLGDAKTSATSALHALIALGLATIPPRTPGEKRTVALLHRPDHIVECEGIGGRVIAERTIKRLIEEGLTEPEIAERLKGGGIWTPSRSSPHLRDDGKFSDALRRAHGVK